MRRINYKLVHLENPPQGSTHYQRSDEVASSPCGKECHSTPPLAHPSPFRWPEVRRRRRLEGWFGEAQPLDGAYWTESVDHAAFYSKDALSTRRHRGDVAKLRELYFMSLHRISLPKHQPSCKPPSLQASEKSLSIGFLLKYQWGVRQAGLHCVHNYEESCIFED